LCGGTRAYALGRERAATLHPPLRPQPRAPGALIIIAAVTAALYVVQYFNAADDYRWDRFGLRPRSVDGLWGVLIQPVLHSSWSHLLANAFPFAAIGWVLLLSGVRVFVFVTACVVVIGDLATWLVAPSDEVIVGASGLIFGWIGYLLARAVFSRRFKWIIVAVLVLVFFGTLLGGLLPTRDSSVSWQSHVCCAVVGIATAWLLHPRRPASARPARRAPVR
jgi:membrane associated rhomboid family serine protease